MARWKKVLIVLSSLSLLIGVVVYRSRPKPAPLNFNSSKSGAALDMYDVDPMPSGYTIWATSSKHSGQVVGPEDLAP